MDSGHQIQLSGVEMQFATPDGVVVALESTDLSVGVGEFVVLLGPSGCGKTTMLRIIGGLLKPSAGQVHVGDRNLWNGDKRDDVAVQELGIVFQEASLFPWMSIEDNIGLPLRIKLI